MMGWASDYLLSRSAYIHIIAECLSMRHIIVTGPAALGLLYCQDPHIFIYVRIYGKIQKYMITCKHSLRRAPLLKRLYMLPLKQLDMVMQTIITAFCVVFYTCY